MKNFHKLIVILVLLGLPFMAEAQFYSVGDDPGRLKWYSIESRNYRIIYPRGLDSLARVYGEKLEQYRLPVGASAGYFPGEMTRQKLPVILHACNAQSNGSVAWAPKRMDLFTSPQGYGAEAMPWEKMLAIHESRHVAQMQFGLSNAFRPFYWIFGEMFAGAMPGIYPSKWMLEGDAVVAETALTDAGRGRSADFLNYYMAAFDNGDFRNWNRWRYGSFKYFTPDHYALGYMTISGIRYSSGKAGFMGEYLTHVSRRPYDIFSYTTISKRYTGKNFRRAFDATMHLYHDIWSKEKSLRAPFLKAEQISRPRKEYTEYSDIFVAGDTVYALKESMGRAKSLVMRLPSGKEKTLTSFGVTSGPLWHSPETCKVWWSEYISDERWSQEIHSVIRYCDLKTGKKKSFTKKGKKFCPSVSADGKLLAVTDYPAEGGSGIEIFDIESGKSLKYVHAPDSLQVTEAVFAAGGLFIAGISEHGYGLYSEDFLPLLGPEPVKITRLRPLRNGLMFTSGKNGVNELYSYSPDDGTLRQMTSTEYGAGDFTFSSNGTSLYYAAVRHDGKPVMSVPADSLLHRETAFSDIHRYRIADELSRQEKLLSDVPEINVPDQKDSAQGGGDTVLFSNPERYRKFAHLFNIHSWAPVYFNVDNIMDLSYDYFYELASPGAAAVIQNNLGTMSANFGYSVHKDPYDMTAWRHSGHLKFTYSGLYPVIEASLDINDRAAFNYTFNQYDGTGVFLSMTGRQSSRPCIKGSLTVYVPFNFSSGGWSRGIIPQVSYSISNDLYDTGVLHWKMLQATGIPLILLSAGSKEEGLSIPAQSVTAAVRAYTIRSAAQSEIYPDWGIGIETGVSMNAGLARWFSPVGYLYAYGYLPGITHSQGLRLGAMYQRQLNGGAVFDTGLLNTLPRGLTASGDLRNEIMRARSSAKISADYAIPIYLGDFSIGPVFYGKRAVVTPHFDWTFIGGGDGLFSGGGLFSAGVTAQIEFGCFFWIGTPVSIGLTWSYNGGPSFSRLEAAGIDMPRNYFGPAISFSLPQ